MSKVVDPVCRMEVDPTTAKFKTEYEGGKVYYFCCGVCLDEFKKNPHKYVSKPCC